MQIWCTYVPVRNDTLRTYYHSYSFRHLPAADSRVVQAGSQCRLGQRRLVAHASAGDDEQEAESEPGMIARMISSKQDDYEYDVPVQFSYVMQTARLMLGFIELEQYRQYEENGFNL